MYIRHYLIIMAGLACVHNFLHASQAHIQKNTGKRKASQVLTAHQTASQKIIEHSLNHILLAATKNNDLVAIQELFSGDEIPYIEAKNRGDCTALILAAADGYDDIVTHLIAMGADLEARELFDNTPLTLAARNGHRAVVNQLIVAGADLNAKNFNGFTALMLAAQNNHMIIVQQLVAAGADVTEYNKKDGDKVAGDYAIDRQVYEKAVAEGLAERKEYCARQSD